MFFFRKHVLSDFWGMLTTLLIKNPTDLGLVFAILIYGGSKFNVF